MGTAIVYWGYMGDYGGITTQAKKTEKPQAMLSLSLEDPPPCNSGIIRIQEDLNIIPIIPYGHYYWVGGSTCSLSRVPR